MTRAKFTCISVTKRKGWGEFAHVFDFEFSAVTKLDPAKTREAAEENESFFAATPAGNIKLSSVRGDLFEVGETYYVDFARVEGLRT